MEKISKLTIKRINNDYLKYIEDDKSSTLLFDVYPNPDNILEVYFALIGVEGTPYEGGVYIGKILHNPAYPLSAPDYIMFTPNGRFEVNKKICLTTSGFHQDHWVAAAWNLTTLLQGFASIWHSDIKEDKIGISHIKDTTVTALKKFAKESVNFNLKNFKDIFAKFPKMKKYL